MAAAFYIDNIAIKNPNTYSAEHYTLTQSTRVANGDMVMDFVANKRKFTLGYNAISGMELNTIIDVLWSSLATSKKCFHVFMYLENGLYKSATVYAGSIPKKLHRGDSGTWIWKDVNISLIEK